MAKSLSSMNPQQRDLAISRRLRDGLELMERGESPGLGYWAARDARANYQPLGAPAKPIAHG